MPDYFVYAIAGIAAVCVFLLAWGIHLYNDERIVVGSLGKKDTAPKRQAGPRPSAITELQEMLGTPFGKLVQTMLGNERLAKVRKRIVAAGRPGGITVEKYAKQRAGAVILYGGLGGLLIYGGQNLVGFLLVLLGFFQTDLTLIGKARVRQQEIEKSLPDFLDILTVTVTAGLGFRHALARVTERIEGPLSEEFAHALRQMDLGTPRREAFEELRRNNSCPQLGTFITAILQAEELGAPLAQALTDISMDMRREFAQGARRRAQQTVPRITAVTTFLMVPGVMVLVLGALLIGTAGEDLGLLG